MSTDKDSDTVVYQNKEGKKIKGKRQDEADMAEKGYRILPSSDNLVEWLKRRFSE